MESDLLLRGTLVISFLAGVVSRLSPHFDDHSCLWRFKPIPFWPGDESTSMMGDEQMDKIEAVRLALAEIGNVTAEELAAFVKARFGVTVGPRIVPIIKATLLDKERMAAAQQKRVAEAAAATPANSTTTAS